MRFVLLVLTPPDMGASARHALKFAEATIAGGHSIGCVFFFDAGALTAASGAAAAQDEEDIRHGWSGLASQQGLDLVACVASAQRFGIEEHAVAPGFSIAGLGSLIEATANADRVITFRG